MTPNNGKIAAASGVQSVRVRNEEKPFFLCFNKNEFAFQIIHSFHLGTQDATKNMMLCYYGQQRSAALGNIAVQRCG